MTYTTQTFIKKAKEVHGDKYNYDNVIYVDSTKKVIITCNVHKNKFEQRPAQHIQGSGCRLCDSESRSKKQTWTTEQFINASKERYPGKFDYKLTKYIDYSSDVTIICIIHDTKFDIKANYHNSDKNTSGGCPGCKYENLSKLRARPIEDFITLCREVYDNTYNYDKVEYVNDKTKVLIGCYNHTDEITFFEQQPMVHLKGSGCPSCAYENLSKLKLRPLEDFITLCKEVHGNIYNYDHVEYINSHTKVLIGCSKHQDDITFFEQQPSAHLQGQGCPSCYKYKNEEKCRVIIENLTNSAFPKGQPTFLGKMSYDCYNESLKLALEYDGEQHSIYIPKFFHKEGYHKFEEQQQRDALKTQLSIDNNIYLIRVNYDEKNKEEYISNEYEKYKEWYIIHKN